MRFIKLIEATSGYLRLGDVFKFYKRAGIVGTVVSTNMDAEALKFSDTEDEDEETFQLVERLASVIAEVSF